MKIAFAEASMRLQFGSALPKARSLARRTHAAKHLWPKSSSSMLNDTDGESSAILLLTLWLTGDNAQQHTDISVM